MCINIYISYKYNLKISKIRELYQQNNYIIEINHIYN
jgi:hypothetical protein